MIPQDIAEKLAGDMGWRFRRGTLLIPAYYVYQNNGLNHWAMELDEDMDTLHWFLYPAGAFDVLVKMKWGFEPHPDFYDVDHESFGYVRDADPIRAIEKAVIAYYSTAP